MAIGFLARKIQEDINNFAPNVRTRVVNGIIFLEGSVDSVDQAKRAGNVAALYLPEVRPGNVLERVDPSAQRATAPRSLIQNFIVVNPPPPRKQEKLIRVTVHFVDTNQYKKYVTIANSLTDIPNPLFFTGIDEREWNCYVQGLVPTRLMLDGKPIC
jgi:hypothetical protein